MGQLHSGVRSFQQRHKVIWTRECSFLFQLIWIYSIMHNILFNAFAFGDLVSSSVAFFFFFFRFTAFKYFTDDLFRLAMMLWVLIRHHVLYISQSDQ